MTRGFVLFTAGQFIRGENAALDDDVADATREAMAGGSAFLDARVTPFDAGGILELIQASRGCGIPG